MNNIPEVKLGLVTVSRGGFILSISQNRMEQLAKAYEAMGGIVYSCPIIVEQEVDAIQAVKDVKQAGCNVLCVLLGNFGPETAETIVGQRFQGPVMYCAAAEETTEVLHTQRGDAYCGLLNCSYNLDLRQVSAFLPEKPVGNAEELAEEMFRFAQISRALLGVQDLKIITFGPRPQDFLACNAPIEPLYRLGIEIEENSELDLLCAYRLHENDPRIPNLVAEMQADVTMSVQTSEILPRLAQYELTLRDWATEHKGSRSYVAFANKCWPAFQPEFGFTPCYVNGRLTADGIPVSCKVDVYGALSEYIGLCLSQQPVALLDINNTVPADLHEKYITGYTLHETFMGFHCGNASACLLNKPVLKEHVILKRALEPDCEPDITRGTIEGDLKAGSVSMFRLQSTATGQLKAYVAQGEILPVPSHSFGSIGVFGIPEMERFYRHVLLKKRFPHHAAVVWGDYSNLIFDVFSCLNIEDISYNQPKSERYPTENPFRK